MNQWPPLCHSLLIGLVCGAAASVAAELHAAKAPLSKKQLEKESQYIVTGKALAISSKTKKSKYERAFGIHRDRVYTIRLKVTTVLKGASLKQGQEIIVQAWQPSTRIPPLSGLQGHQPIPTAGDTVKMYLRKPQQAKEYEPLLPNGINIQKKAE